jgi:hypothetical protein
MLFVMTLTWQTGLTRDQRDGALMRRSQWHYPDGVKVHGEYWPSSERVAVVSIFETDDHGALMEIGLTWGDMFQVEIAPAVNADDGLRLGPEAMARRLA